MKKVKIILLVILVIILLGAIGYLVYDYWNKNISTPEPPEGPSAITPPPKEIKEEIKFFKNEKEFKEYLDKGESLGSIYDGLGGGGEIALEASSLKTEDASFSQGSEPDRVSKTNVQVDEIDEPDIVKTDGKEIYFASQDTPSVYPESIPDDLKPRTHLFKAFPYEELAKDKDIEENGTYLLQDKNLVIFHYSKVSGHDVSNPQNPEKKWTFEIDDRTSYHDARLYDDKIYLITQSHISNEGRCPIELGKLENEKIEMPCTDIYYPTKPIPTNITYNILVLDPKNGEIKKQVSFVGFSRDATIYMSPENIFVAYGDPGDMVKFVTDFVSEENFNLLPDYAIEKIKKANALDISYEAKYTELTSVIEKHLNSLSSDEQLKQENKLSNAFKDYHQKNLRSFERTGIVKIERKSLNIEANSYVPGSLHDQFSLDEYENHLRLAVTLGRRTFWMFGGDSAETISDLYVLDKDLSIVGKVNDLGKNERIYSTRFIGDKGYLVTFRETDPFFVFDLADPKNPELKGELKIPGYSSYLHPIDKDKVLGIGKEDNEVKISLFDVSNPSDPKEASKFTINEYWSDVLSTHHAFLHDAKHKIFFLPGQKGGYVFSYENNNIDLVHTASDIDAVRAIYINDYLYILGQKEIRVYDEKTWEEVKKLEF